MRWDAMVSVLGEPARVSADRPVARLLLTHGPDSGEVLELAYEAEPGAPPTLRAALSEWRRGSATQVIATAQWVPGSDAAPVLDPELWGAIERFADAAVVDG